MNSISTIYYERIFAMYALSNHAQTVRPIYGSSVLYVLPKRPGSDGQSFAAIAANRLVRTADVGLSDSVREQRTRTKSALDKTRIFLGCLGFPEFNLLYVCMFYLLNNMSLYFLDIYLKHWLFSQ